jgi:hypothetical protein
MSIIQTTTTQKEVTTTSSSIQTTITTQTTTTTMISTTTTIVGEFNFRPKNCNDYLATTKEGESTTLSDTIKDGTLSVYSTSSLWEGVKEGIAVKLKDIEVVNNEGIIQGYFTVFDRKEDVVASSLNVTMKIYEVKNLTGEVNNLLYSQDFSLLWSDFKEVLTSKDVVQWGNETIEHNYPEIGYVFNNTHITSFDRQPVDCLGLITMNYTNKAGQTFSGSTLFLFNDMNISECNTDSDCMRCAGLCKNTDFKCLYPDLLAKGLENATCSCFKGYCSTDVPNTNYKIIDKILFDSGIPVGVIDNLPAK